MLVILNLNALLDVLFRSRFADRFGYISSILNSLISRVIHFLSSLPFLESQTIDRNDFVVVYISDLCRKSLHFLHFGFAFLPAIATNVGTQSAQFQIFLLFEFWGLFIHILIRTSAPLFLSHIASFLSYTFRSLLCCIRCCFRLWTQLHSRILW